mmetsp:Transcript_147537/g.256059  ORF Transcript_147537/g.256059 Transcript_147537/m.256059 type:complete len:209 (-) Transcript_147537:967-1593(-)
MLTLASSRARSLPPKPERAAQQRCHLNICNATCNSAQVRSPSPFGHYRPQDASVGEGLREYHVCLRQHLISALAGDCSRLHQRALGWQTPGWFICWPRWIIHWQRNSRRATLRQRVGRHGALCWCRRWASVGVALPVHPLTRCGPGGRSSEIQWGSIASWGVTFVPGSVLPDSPAGTKESRLKICVGRARYSKLARVLKARCRRAAST